MHSQDIASIVHACASTHCVGRPAVMNDDTTFDDLGMDSLACICMIVDIEDATGIRIGCADRISFERLGDVVSFLSERSLPLAA